MLAFVATETIGQSLPSIPGRVPQPPGPTVAPPPPGPTGSYSGSTRATLRTSNGLLHNLTISWSGDGRSLTVTSQSSAVADAQQQDAYDSGRAALSRNTGISLPPPAATTTAGRVGQAGQSVGGKVGEVSGTVGQGAETASRARDGSLLRCTCGRTSASGTGSVAGQSLPMSLSHELSGAQLRQSVTIQNYRGAFTEATARSLFQ
ncbi:MAG TPA: hypothetical protein VJ890_05555 [Vineibacter sp.]|nr:hypothetical protein [Vineibacter sp.]